MHLLPSATVRHLVAGLLFLLSCTALSQADTPTVTTDGAWCWFQDPRAVHVRGKFDRTYATWMTHDGKLQAGAFDHATGKCSTTTIREAWDRDDHNVGAFLVLPDRRLMLFYARHNKTGILCRTTTQPEDITQWEPEVTVSDEPRISYAHPVWLSTEKRFYLFWRGQTWKPTYSTSTDGRTWSKPRILIQDPAGTAAGIRPYLKVCSNGVDTIHFTFTNGHPRNEPLNSVHYLCYRDGAFYRADGSRVADTGSLPIAPARCDVVYDAQSTGNRAWVWDIAIDAKGLPVIAYTRLPSEKDHRYHYAAWTGTKWSDHEIVAGGGWFPQTPPKKTEPEPHYSGGISLDPVDPSRLCLSRPVKGVFEIEEWITPDSGATWKSRAVTSGSKALNVRPVIPRGPDRLPGEVLWMNGSYEHYTRYRTSLHISTPAP